MQNRITILTFCLIVRLLKGIICVHTLNMEQLLIYKLKEVVF